MGGNVDITSGGSKFAPLHEVVAYGLENGLNLERLTMSSDGNGSVPKFNENGELVGLWLCLMRIKFRGIASFGEK